MARNVPLQTDISSHLPYVAPYMYHYKQIKIGKHKILLLLLSLLLLLHVCIFKYASYKTQLNLKDLPVRKKYVLHIMTTFVIWAQLSFFLP